jgi:hypothetical protein
MHNNSNNDNNDDNNNNNNNNNNNINNNTNNNNTNYTNDSPKPSHKGMLHALTTHIGIFYLDREGQLRRARDGKAEIGRRIMSLQSEEFPIPTFDIQQFSTGTGIDLWRGQRYTHTNTTYTQYTQTTNNSGPNKQPTRVSSGSRTSNKTASLQEWKQTS